MARRLSLSQYLDGILAGDRVVLSRAITLCESLHSDDKRLARELLHACLPHAGNSIRVGITGAPGVGKSTFIDALGMTILESGEPVAVLAIDPSSSRTRGSILGDKTRMARLSQEKRAYVRPSPSAGSLGGVAMKTKETMILCEAAGFRWLVVETVGVGQSEVEVRDLVDVFLLLMLPNAGDDLQGIKMGIMEMADLLVVNKAEGANEVAANRAKALYSQALRMFPLPDNGIRPPVLTCSALTGLRIGEVMDTLLATSKACQSSGAWQRRRSAQEIHWFDRTLEAEWKARFFREPVVQAAYQVAKAELQAGRTLPLDAAWRVMEAWEGGSNSEALH